VGDLVAARLALPDRAAQPPERLEEEGRDEVGLQLPGLGPLHRLLDLQHLAGVHGIPRQRPLLQQRLQVMAVQRVVDDPLQPSSHLGIVAVANGLYQQVAQWLLHEDLAQHVEDLAAQCLAFLLQLVEEPLKNVALAGLGSHQVPEVADLGRRAGDGAPADPRAYWPSIVL
jgi:hypothetical protein